MGGRAVMQVPLFDALSGRGKPYASLASESLGPGHIFRVTRLHQSRSGHGQTSLLARAAARRRATSGTLAHPNLNSHMNS